VPGIPGDNAVLYGIRLVSSLLSTDRFKVTLIDPDCRLRGARLHGFTGTARQSVQAMILHVP
jgi:hypothetical protein